jgi:hypothetical protein
LPAAWPASASCRTVSTPACTAQGDDRPPARARGLTDCRSGPGLTSGDALELLVKAPTPEQAAKLTKTQITAALACQRRRNRDQRAAAIQTALREPQLGIAAPVAAAYASATVAHASLMPALNEQIQMLEEQVSAHFLAHPDAEIYLSMPGIGEITGARVLAVPGCSPSSETTRPATTPSRPARTLPAPAPSPAPPAGRTPSTPDTHATTVSPTPSTSRRSPPSAPRPAPGATTTNSAPATPAATPPRASSAPHHQVGPSRFRQRVMACAPRSYDAGASSSHHVPTPSGELFERRPSRVRCVSGIS